MRKMATIFAAASLAVAGMGIAGCQNQDKADQSSATDLTGSTHGGVRTGSGVAGRNPSNSPSLGGSQMGGTAGMNGGSGTMDARTAGARGTSGGGAGGIGAAGTTDANGNVSGGVNG